MRKAFSKSVDVCRELERKLSAEGQQLLSWCCCCQDIITCVGLVLPKSFLFATSDSVHQNKAYHILLFMCHNIICHTRQNHRNSIVHTAFYVLLPHVVSWTCLFLFFYRSEQHQSICRYVNGYELNSVNKFNSKWNFTPIYSAACTAKSGQQFGLYISWKKN